MRFFTLVLFVYLAVAVYAESQCATCLPWVTDVGVGFDVVTGESLYPIAEFSYNKGYTWANPFNQIVYLTPDQVKVSGAETLGVESYVFRSSAEYASQLATDAGLGAGFGFGAVFSLSASVTDMNEQFAGGAKVISYTRQYCTLHKLTLQPLAMLNYTQAFIEAVDALPSTENYVMYQEFLSQYGTHFISEAVFGGVAIMQGSVDESYTKNYTDLVVQLNAKLTFSESTLGLGGTYSYSKSSESFQSATNGQMECNAYGGAANYSCSDWQQWVQSVKVEPLRVSYTLMSIAELIEDTTKQQLLQNYINLYISKNNQSSNITPTPTFPVPLSMCNCSKFNNQAQCPPGFLLVGAQLDGLSFLNLQTPITCCQPCSSFMESNAFPNPQVSSSYSEPEMIIKFNDVSAEASMCGSYPCLPGMDQLGIGFDLVYGTKKGQQVVSFTYTNQTTWKNNDINQVYSIPDNTWVSAKPGKLQSSFYARSQEEYASQVAQNVLIGASIPGAFSLSIDVQWSDSVFSGAQSVLAVFEEYEIVYQAEILLQYPYSSFNGTPEFNYYSSQLPEVYDYNSYQSFVDIFGTHVVVSGNYGGKSHMKTVVDQQYYSEQNTLDVNIMAGVSFVYSAFVEAGFNSSTSFNDFLQSSFSECYLYGGNYEAWNVSNWAEWFDTVQYAPALLQYQLEPISYFIANAVVANNLQNHINTYLQDNILNDPIVPESLISLENCAPSTNNNHNYCPSDSVVTGFSSASCCENVLMLPVDCCEISVASIATEYCMAPVVLNNVGQCPEGMMLVGCSGTTMGGCTPPIYCAPICYDTTLFI